MMARRRPWYTHALVMGKTVLRTASILHAQELDSATPVFVALLLLAGLLWAVSAVAPLAPFVYSLF